MKLDESQGPGGLNSRWGCFIDGGLWCAGHQHIECGPLLQDGQAWCG